MHNNYAVLQLARFSGHLYHALKGRNKLRPYISLDERTFLTTTCY